MSTENNNETPKKMITLRSCDGETFQVEEQELRLSQTLKHFVEDGSAEDSCIPIPNVSGPILAKVIEYSKKHAEPANETEADLKAFDAEFIKVENSTLLGLIKAAHYLNIKSLLDLVSQTVAHKMMDMSVEQIRVMFNITSDFTEEEELAVRNENVWAFE